MLVTINTKYSPLSLPFSHQAGVCSHVHSPSRWPWRLRARWPARCQAGVGQDGADVWAGAVVAEAPVMRDKIR